MSDKTSLREMFKTLLFLVLLISNSYCDDEVDVDLLSELEKYSQIESDPIGKGFIVSPHHSDVTYDNLTDSLECLRQEDFDTGFVVLYSSGDFLDYNVPWIENLEEEGMKVQIVIAPSNDETPDSVFNKFLNGLTRNNLTIDYLWIDTANIVGKFPDSINLLNGLEVLAAKNSIVVGIKTTIGAWVYDLNNPNFASSKNQLLWLDTYNPSFSTFQPFAGWESVSVLTSNTRTRCVLNSSNGKPLNTISTLYRRDDIDNQLTHNTDAPPPVPSDDPANDGRGFVISIDSTDSYWTDFDTIIPCILQNYDTVFLYLYNGDNYIDQAEELILRIIEVGLNVQFVVKPNSSGNNSHPMHVVDTISYRLNKLKIYPSMIWLDTSLFSMTGSDDNIRSLRIYNNLFAQQGMQVHITTRLQQWNDYFDNIKTWSSSGMLLWDDKELMNEASYIPFGGWKSVSLYTYVPTHNCSTNVGFYSLYASTYKKDRFDFSLDPHTLKPVTFPVTSTVATPAPNGRGIVIKTTGDDYEDLHADVKCYVENKYQTLFLYVLKDNVISTQLLDMLNIIPSFPLNVQFVIQPVFVNPTAEPTLVITKLVEAINSFGYNPQYFWIDVSAAGGNPKSDDNVALLQTYLSVLQTFRIDFGIVSDPDLWTKSMGGYRGLGSKLLWDDSNLSDFGNFTPFGDWKDVAVYSHPYTGLSCPDVKTTFSYGDAFYRGSELNFNLPPVSTVAPPPTNGGSSSSVATTTPASVTTPEVHTSTKKTASSVFSFLCLSLPLLRLL